VSLHEHNESQRTPELLARLAAGGTIALVSDAGTPLLSDPGLELVQRAARAGFRVHAIPGPSAITSALAVAGLPTGRSASRASAVARARAACALAALAHEPRTLVFFEAPHRILRTLADMAAEFGAERAAAVARELTKAHETVYAARCRSCSRARRRKRTSSAARSPSWCTAPPRPRAPSMDSCYAAQWSCSRRSCRPAESPRSPRS